MNITFLDLEKWEEEYLQEKLAGAKNVKLDFYRQKLSDKLLGKIKNTEILALFIYSQLDKKALEKLPKLKYITTMSTGFDHIDLDFCRERKIKVSNVPTYGENTVAEHTFALILELSRRMFESIERVNKFDFHPQGLCGFDLKDKTIGIVGLGNIGEHVARMAKGFEMKVIVSDPRRNSELAKKLGVKYVSLENLLRNSDIITLHAPYNEHTHHLVNKKNIGEIKKGAYLINTARGGLVETEALVSAIKKGIIAGAGLDVLEEEMFIKEEKELLTRQFQRQSNLKTVLQNHWLIQDPRVIVTPHNAFNSEEALRRILDTTVGNILNFLQGKWKNKVVNL